MDKRLPHRIREVREQFAAEGRVCDSEGVRVELCKKHSEYVRLKQQPLRRLIAQQLSTPLPPASADQPDGGPKKRRRVGSPSSKHFHDPSAAEATDGGTLDGAETGATRETMNGSLRRMYAPPKDQGPAEKKAPPVKNRAAKQASGSRAVMMRGAMAAARRENGLSEPEKTFEPEEQPEERLDDLGGVDAILDDIRQLVVHPLAHPEVFDHLGVEPPTGVLLHGPPGSGKTKLAHAIAGTTGVPFFKVAATEIVSGMSGESEAKVRQLFQAAIGAAPSLLFLDEIDAITPKRDSAGREMERRIVAQLLTCMDELRSTHVVVLGATNRPDALDPALRRAGRFDREIAMGIPDEAARAHILQKMTAGMRLAEDLDLSLLARLTPGFVGADLSSLTKEAALGAVSRAFQDLGALRDGGEGGDGAKPVPYTAAEMEPLSVTMADFKAAVGKVQPSARREGFATVPDVSWSDVGALSDVRADLDAAICEPIRKAELFKQLGLTTPSGVLLYGPPGCGKTLLAKATANASGANFIAIKGPELLNKYVGESERAVRLVFQRALSSAPCVVFFDELDALVPRRSAEGSSSAERVVNQMLTEMDGVQQRSQVYVIGATNRPDIVDPAMLRPGRLDRLLFVPFPSEAGRLEILRAHTRRLPLASDVSLPSIAEQTGGFSGADLAALAREAAMIAIRSSEAPSENASAQEVAAAVQISRELFRQALGRVHPSVGAEERKEYETLATRLSGRKPGAVS